MTERKEHEIGEKDQRLYSNLSTKCAGFAERGQCFIFNLLLCPFDFSGSKKTYMEDLRGRWNDVYFFNIP